MPSCSGARHTKPVIVYLSLDSGSSVCGGGVLITVWILLSNEFGKQMATLSKHFASRSTKIVLSVFVGGRSNSSIERAVLRKKSIVLDIVLDKVLDLTILAVDGFV